MFIYTDRDFDIHLILLKLPLSFSYNLVKTYKKFLDPEENRILGSKVFHLLNIILSYSNISMINSSLQVT